jgi:hypothetical protein
MALQLNLPFMKKPPEQAVPNSPDSPSKGIEEELRHSIYKMILDRYRDMIEEHETRSVADLKAAITPHDPKIQQMREKLIEPFHPYIYEEHFYEAAKMACAYVSSFRTVSVPISFWLSFADMQELMAGDEIDKAILMCCLLRSLGSNSSKVFVTDTKSAYVLFQFGSKSFVATHEGLVEKESGEQAISSLNGKVLYSFNDKEYEDFQDVD